MSSFLDLDSWERKEHYQYFKNYVDPFFTICATVNVSQTLNYSKTHKHSFFLASLYLSSVAANSIKEFRYRLDPNGVRVHKTVHPSSAVIHKDNSFSFCDFVHHDKFQDFNKAAKELLEQNNDNPQELDALDEQSNLLYYTVIPWLHFTSFTHPKQKGNKDSIPKIAFGKYEGNAEALKMPVSVEVNHALMDGFHGAEFFKNFQALLDEPEKTLGK